MTTADHIFTALVYVAWPAAFLYPLIYATQTRWWITWVGQALLLKAIGVFLLLTVSALFLFFGPDYFMRDTVRITGMALLAGGLWYALVAMLAEFRRRDGRQ